MRAPLEATFNLMLEYNRAISLEDVYRVTLDHAARYGATSLLAGIIPDRIIHPSEQPNYVVLGHWPQDWAARYFQKQYVRRDPTIHHAATAIDPLIWSDIEYDERDPGPRQIMQEAREFRLVDGITIPQLTIEGLRIGVSFSGEYLDKSPRSVMSLTVLASYSVTRALQIRTTLRETRVVLTRRERECLLWVAEGKTIADTGDILGISDKTVDKHLATARAKLDALSTAQAIAQAIRLGLL